MCHSAHGRIGLVLCAILLTGTRAWPKEYEVPVKQTFEKRYESWKSWVKDNQFLSDYTANKRFQDIVALGPPAVPLLIEKIEKNPEDFHLGAAVGMITGKRFEKSEWPGGKFAGSRTAARMYVKWWKKDRGKTKERFDKLFKEWLEQREGENEAQADHKYEQIVHLGIPILPFLVERVRENPVWIDAIATLTRGEVSTDWNASQVEEWWTTHQEEWALPPLQSEKPTEE